MALSTFEWLILIAIFLFSFIGTGVWAFIKVRNLRWNYTYVVWKSVGGSDRQEPVERGRCRLIKIGDMGEEVFYLQKSKVYRMAYGKRVGKNTIYWTVGDDGLWYNTEVGNFNNNFKSLGLMPVDRDIRYASTSVRKLLDKKYNKMDKMTQTFMIIVFILLVVAVGVSGATAYISFSKQQKISALNNEGLKIQEETAKLFNEALNKIDIIQSGGKGYTEQIP